MPNNKLRPLGRKEKVNLSVDNKIGEEMEPLLSEKSDILNGKNKNM